MENEIYNKNKASFMNFAKNKSEILEKLDGIKVENVGVENDIVAVEKDNRLWYLNSCYDSKECARIYASQYSDVKYNALLLVFGFGNGDYIRELLKQVNNKVVIIYEPDPQIFKAVMDTIDISDILEDSRVFMAVADVCYEYLKEYLITFVDYSNMKINVLLSLPQYNIIYGDEYKHFSEYYIEEASSVVFTRNTFYMYGKEFVQNALSTIPDAIRQYSVCQAKATIEKMDVEHTPAILVSAGPSLDKNVALLKEAKGKAFIMVVDTALKSVIRSGVMPDLTITIDSHKHITLFENSGFENVPMIVSLNSNPKIYPMHKAKRFYYCAGDEYLAYIYKDFKRNIIKLESGGSVANDAFSFLRYVGFKNIILIGQDLAYPNNQGHSKEAYDGNEKKIEYTDNGKYLYVEDIFGNQVLTEQNMDMYRKWFESQILRYKDLNVIDATEGGALIHGSTIMTLREALDKYCSEDIQIEGIFDNLQPVFDEQEQKKIFETIRDIPRQLDEDEKLIKQGIKDYERLLELAGKGKYSGSEYKKTVDKISEINKFVENDAVLCMVSKYVMKEQYEVLENVYNYDNELSQYTQIREITEHGTKMLNAYLDGIEKFRQDYPILLENMQ